MIPSVCRLQPCGHIGRRRDPRRSSHQARCRLPYVLMIQPTNFRTLESLMRNSTSTTFRHPKPSSAATPGFTEQKKGELYNDKPKGYTGTEGDDAPPYDPQHPDRHIYSRYTQPVMTRTEKVLSAALVSFNMLRGLPSVRYHVNLTVTHRATQNGHAIMFTTGLSVSNPERVILHSPTS